MLLSKIQSSPYLIMQTVRVMFYLTLARYTDKKPLSGCKIVNERRTTHDDGRTIAKCHLRDSVTEKFNTYTLCSNMGPTQGSWTRGKEFHNLGRGHHGHDNHGFSFSKINGSRCFSVGYLGKYVQNFYNVQSFYPRDALNQKW